MSNFIVIHKLLKVGAISSLNSIILYGRCEVYISAGARVKMGDFFIARAGGSSIDIGEGCKIAVGKDAVLEVGE